MHGGDDRNTATALYAQFIRGSTVTAYRIDQVHAMDLVADPKWVKATVTLSIAGERFRSVQVFGYDSGATAWKFYGDQRFWEQNWSELVISTWSNFAPAGPADEKQYQVWPNVRGWVPLTGNTGNDAADVLTSDGTRPSMTVAALPPVLLGYSGNQTEDAQGVPVGAPLTFYKDLWKETSPSAVYDPGVTVERDAYLALGGQPVSITGTIRRTGLPGLSPGDTQTTNWRIGGLTTEFLDPVIDIPGVSTTTGSATANNASDIAGKTITLSWSAPTTFVLAYANVGLDSTTDGVNWTYVNGTRPLVGGVLSNSGSVVVPAGTTEAGIQVWLFGLNGEAVRYYHEFK
jgi:hypothetical protein